LGRDSSAPHDGLDHQWDSRPTQVFGELTDVLDVSDERLVVVTAEHQYDLDPDWVEFLEELGVERRRPEVLVVVSTGAGRPRHHVRREDDVDVGLLKPVLIVTSEVRPDEDRVGLTAQYVIECLLGVLESRWRSEAEAVVERYHYCVPRWGV
jgi:hypothetical protein